MSDHRPHATQLPPVSNRGRRVVPRDLGRGSPTPADSRLGGLRE